MYRIICKKQSVVVCNNDYAKIVDIEKKTEGCVTLFSDLEAGWLVLRVGQLVVWIEWPKFVVKQPKLANSNSDSQAAEAAEQFCVLTRTY